jgi:hypothetical protein
MPHIEGFVFRWNIAREGSLQRKEMLCSGTSLINRILKALFFKLNYFLNTLIFAIY